MICKQVLGKMKNYDIMFTRVEGGLFLYKDFENDNETFFYDYCNRIVKEDKGLRYVLQ